MLALLHGEPAAQRVRAALAGGGAGASWINLGEAYYIAARQRGHGRAATAVEALARDLRVEEPDAALVLAAARVKANHALSYADAFAVATAERHRAPLLTGDPEIVALERGLTVIDLRQPG